MEQIAENPYLQYFLGLMAYQAEAPFHHSLLTTFRKYLTHDSFSAINEAIVRRIAAAQPTKAVPTNKDPIDAKRDDVFPPPNWQLLLDAMCVPAKINYPTDLHLLDDAREKTEAIIDNMYTYR